MKPTLYLEHLNQFSLKTLDIVASKEVLKYLAKPFPKETSTLDKQMYILYCTSSRIVQLLSLCFILITGNTEKDRFSVLGYLQQPVTSHTVCWLTPGSPSHM